MRANSTLSAGKPALLHVFPSLEVGGAQIRFRQLAIGTASEFRHLVYAMNGDYSLLDDPVLAAKVETVRADYPAGRLIPTLLAFRKALRALRPHLLLTYNFGAIEWALANRIFPLCPMIDTEDGFGAAEAVRELPRRRFLRRLAYRGCAVQIVPSTLLERKAIGDWNMPQMRVRRIPNGIDCSRFERGTRPSWLEGRKNVIVTVAGLRPEKNLIRLLDAFALLKDPLDATLVIAGEGPEKERLIRHSKMRGLGGRVIFAGHQDPALLLPGCDVFTLSSDTEQMPVSVLEAMASGLPVVSTDAGDTAEMVAAPNRPYIAGRDAETLARNFSVLLVDDGLRRSIGAANREKAKAAFSETAMIAAYGRLWQEAAEGLIPGAK